MPDLINELSRNEKLQKYRIILSQHTIYTNEKEVYMLSKFDVSSFYMTLSSSKLNHFSDFGHLRNDPTCSILLTLGSKIEQVKNTGKNNPKPINLTKNSRTTHTIWHKSFSMIQSARIKNWLPQ